MDKLTVVSDIAYYCPKCNLQYEPDVVNIDPHCGRCGYDIGGTIDITEVPATKEEEKRRAGQKGKAEMFLMIDNWFKGYIRVMGDTVNWSFAEEISVEIIEQMIPYIDRLRKEGYIDQEDVKDIGNHFAQRMQDFVGILEQNEELMRLTGQWDDNEQEIKEYWQEKLGKLCRLPMWNDSRGIAAD